MFKNCEKKNNYKILPGDTQINMKKRKYNSIIRRCGVMKMSVLCNLIYKFDIIPVKIQKHFFSELDKCIMKFIRWNKKANKQGRILKRKNNGGGKNSQLALPDSNAHLKLLKLKWCDVGARVNTENDKSKKKSGDRPNCIYKCSAINSELQLRWIKMDMLSDVQITGLLF